MEKHCSHSFNSLLSSLISYNIHLNSFRYISTTSDYCAPGLHVVKTFFALGLLCWVTKQLSWMQLEGWCACEGHGFWREGKAHLPAPSGNHCTALCRQGSQLAQCGRKGKTPKAYLQGVPYSFGLYI